MYSWKDTWILILKYRSSTPDISAYIEISSLNPEWSNSNCFLWIKGNLNTTFIKKRRWFIHNQCDICIWLKETFFIYKDYTISTYLNRYLCTYSWWMNFSFSIENNGYFYLITKLRTYNLKLMDIINIIYTEALFLTNKVFRIEEIWKLCFYFSTSRFCFSKEDWRLVRHVGSGLSTSLKDILHVLLDLSK